MKIYRFWKLNKQGKRITRRRFVSVAGVRIPIEPYEEEPDMFLSEEQQGTLAPLEIGETTTVKFNDKRFDVVRLEDQDNKWFETYSGYKEYIRNHPA